MKALLLLTSIALLAPLSANAADAYIYGPQATFPVPNTLGTAANASLGFGYSSDTGAQAYSTCLIDPVANNLISYAGSDQGTVDIDKNYTMNQFEHQVGMRFAGHISVGKFTAGLATTFSQDMQSDKYSESFIYRSMVQLKNAVYTPPTDQTALNALGQSHLNDPAAFRFSCGNQYVSQVMQGGVVYVGLKFNFAQQADKTRFDRNLTFGERGLFGMYQNFSSMVSKLKQTGQLQVVAYQVGGNAADLGNILNEPGKPVPIATCSFANPAQCQAMINSIIEYTSGSGAKDFPEQLKPDPTNTKPNAAAEIGMVTQRYGFMGVPMQSQSVVTPQITQARSDLAKHLDNQEAMLNRVTYLTKISTDTGYLQALSGAENALTNNVQALNDAGQACFTTAQLGNCSQIAQTTISQLQSINAGLLIGGAKSFKITAAIVYTGDPLVLRNHYGGAPWGGTKNAMLRIHLRNLPASWHQAKVVNIQNFVMSDLQAWTHLYGQSLNACYVNGTPPLLSSILPKTYTPNVNGCPEVGLDCTCSTTEERPNGKIEQVTIPLYQSTPVLNGKTTLAVELQHNPLDTPSWASWGDFPFLVATGRFDGTGFKPATTGETPSVSITGTVLVTGS